MQFQDDDPKMVTAARDAFFAGGETFKRQFGSAEGYVAHMLAATFSKSAALQAEFRGAEVYGAYMVGRANQTRPAGQRPLDAEAVGREFAALAETARAQGHLAGEHA